MAPSRHEKGSGISVGTLVVASVSSAAAAVIVSQFWETGTIISAAITPVIVTLLSESLHRAPTTVVRATTRGGEPMPDASGAAPPAEPGDETPVPEQAGMGEMKVHTGAGRRIRGRVVAGTAALAFLVAGAALTLPELIFGDSVSGGRDTTLFGGKSRHRSKAPATETQTQTVTTPAETQTQIQTQTQPTPTEQVAPQAAPQTQTTPAPVPQQPPAEQPPAAPVP